MKWNRSLLGEAIARTISLLAASCIFLIYAIPIILDFENGRLLSIVPIILVVSMFLLFALPLLLRPRISVIANEEIIVIESPWFTHCGNVTFHPNEIKSMGWKKGLESEDIFVVELQSNQKILLSNLKDFPCSMFVSYIQELNNGFQVSDSKSTLGSDERHK